MNSDSESSNKVGANRPASPLKRMEGVPLLLMMLYVGLAGITVLFVVLIAAYAYTRFHQNAPTGIYPLPRYFSLSTIVLLISSYVIAQAQRLYAQDDLRGLARCLGATFLLSSIFAGLQALGWRELLMHGILFEGMASGTFVYLISAVHVAHLLGGMLFLMTLLLRTHHASRDAVRSLVFIRNPYRRLQLRMITLYWHFIDGVWLALFAAFLFLY
ncbi:cytochrome c oxidase subunit 3 [Hymenobacter metallilatus]|uniref:Cytochrome c oxidase subunit III n=1 Tax=Hymenobacter metallilatus TaxID=2493666 RepID=A0A428IY60_9BACT|nr:cytochrome c oxidase subunit 3 [Hymenobacter metallilatus]RSK24054.1 cytochrome c oxidase subunit III [Hymenobacter metallilatus]